jgi:ribosomal protein S18 acetylase RimI-like enzyme
LIEILDISDNVSTVHEINKSNSETTADISIRPLIAADCAVIANAFHSQGWNEPREKFELYLEQGLDGLRDVRIAESEDEFAGYVTVFWKPLYPYFKSLGIPEIQDFNVLIKFQKRGIGNLLMDAAETLIATRSDRAGIRVGLDADYGAAQRLYVKRGYVPDGNGISHNLKFVKYGDEVIVDDDLILALVKELVGGAHRTGRS